METRIAYSGQDNGENKNRRNVQFSDFGGAYSPTVKSAEQLTAGVYRIQRSFEGIFFVEHKFATDELIRDPSSGYEDLLQEIGKFWELAPNFKEHGFVHSHGILLKGKPGTGKSCIMKLVMEEIKERGDVTFICRDISDAVAGLKAYREVEPTRQVFVAMEDADALIQYGEHALLELMDGDAQINNVLYIATTNYPERFPERLLRVGRFGTQIEVEYPSDEARRTYLNHKLTKYETKERIEDLVELTKGLGYNHLKHYILSVYCFKKDANETINKMRNSIGLPSLNNKWLEGMLEKMSLNEAASADIGTEPSSVRIKKSLEKRLDKLKFEGIFVDEIEVAEDGDVVVTFKDTFGDELAVLFGVDGSYIYAMVLAEYGDEEPVITIDLSPLAPSTFTNEHGSISVDLINLGWMNKSALDTVLTAGSILNTAIGDEEEEEKEDEIAMDAFGYFHFVHAGEEFVQAKVKKADFIERVITTVRSGRSLRIPILRAESKAFLSKHAMKALEKSKSGTKKFLNYIKK